MLTGAPAAHLMPRTTGGTRFARTSGASTHTNMRMEDPGGKQSQAVGAPHSSDADRVSTGAAGHVVHLRRCVLWDSEGRIGTRGVLVHHRRCHRWAAGS